MTHSCMSRMKTEASERPLLLLLLLKFRSNVNHREKWRVVCCCLGAVITASEYTQVLIFFMSKPLIFISSVELEIEKFINVSKVAAANCQNVCKASTGMHSFTAWNTVSICGEVKFSEAATGNQRVARVTRAAGEGVVTPQELTQ